MDQKKTGEFNSATLPVLVGEGSLVVAGRGFAIVVR